MTQQHQMRQENYQENSPETERLIARLLAHFDRLVADSTSSPERLVADYGLPVEAAPLALGLAATALAGMREALTGWQPRPPLEEGEDGGLEHAIAGLVMATTREALAVLTEHHLEATTNARAALMTWNRQRRAVQLTSGPTAVAVTQRGAH